MHGRGAWILWEWLRTSGGLTRPTYTLHGRNFSTEFPDTNCLCANALPRPRCFAVSGVHVFFGRMLGKDREFFRDRYAVRFQVAQKFRYEAPLIALPETGKKLEEMILSVPQEDGA